MQTDLAFDTYLNSTVRWSVLTDPKRYSDNDVQSLTPTFYPPVTLPLKPGFVPAEPEIEPETAEQLNQRVDKQLIAIQARINSAVRNRSATARKAWKTRQANSAAVILQGTNIGKHHG